MTAQSQTSNDIRSPLVFLSAPVSAIRVQSSWRLVVFLYTLLFTTISVHSLLRPGRSRLRRLVTYNNYEQILVAK